MKRILLIALVTLISFNGAIAQSMSDSQIISFIQKEQKKGTSQAQIVTKLMQKGVSVTRLQKLRRTYQNMGKSSMAPTRSSEVAEDSDRSRNANASSQRGGVVGNENSMGLNEPYGGTSSRISEGYGEEEEMASVLNDFMPDSLSYKEKLLEEKIKNRK